MTAYDITPPPGGPDQEYEVTVGKITLSPPVAPGDARYEGFVGNALDADSTFFEEGEPPLPESSAPVTLTCQRPWDDGVCTSSRLRVRGTWDTPAAITCENGHTWQESVDLMRCVIRAVHRAA
ncbi:hypothetical protein ACQEVS_10160 [Streptomyces sp. CA-181903]|uniref:hypothetical protein n=1 Tax=Streptomyces sp. CA-181903 TaxID=3240055 RepID=UPI003D936DC1